MPSRKEMDCHIHTPDGTVFDSTVSSLVLPGQAGQFGVLFNHIPYMASLDIGRIKLETDDGEEELACGGGFAEIKDNEIILLVETAEFPEDIDRKDVKSNIDDFKEKLETDDFEDEFEREELEEELRRAQVRLSVLD